MFMILTMCKLTLIIMIIKYVNNLESFDNIIYQGLSDTRLLFETLEVNNQTTILSININSSTSSIPTLNPINVSVPK